MKEYNSANRNRYFEADGSPKPEALRENPWLVCLLSANRPYVNPERLEKMEDLRGNPVLDYVLRTLDILDEMRDLSDAEYDLIRTVLCWSEVSKTGSDEDRRRWEKRGYPLAIHNEASAMIYADYCHVRNIDTDPVYVMIKTHGLAGQYIRGECCMERSSELSEIAYKIGEDKETFTRIIYALNECIIRAVSDNIWTSVQEKVKNFAERLYPQARIVELLPEERLTALLPKNGSPSEGTTQFFSSEIFGKYDLWYFPAALEPFGFEGAEKICRQAITAAGSADIKHLNFKPLADAMYYDYEGKRHVNTYKQRIIEKYLKDPEEYGHHIRLDFEVKGTAIMIGASFAPACEKLIDFCVEAERSGLLSYEKSITMLYDTFGFRRDSFDRLNNEEKYLQTMNDAEESTKMSIPDYVTGEIIVDVGSGGGVLLNELEKRYPDRKIVGTDISQNVIEALERKKAEENRHWTAIRHNFVDESMPYKVDTVIFSSIIHEIYSYTDLGRGKFDKDSIVRALKNAVDSLNVGGRIVIRDGVKTPGNGKMKIVFKSDEGFQFFRQFLADFRGMDELPDDRKVCGMIPEERTVVTDINFGREFLYTYTWGPESFPHEVQECFGYYTLDEFRDLFDSFGNMRVLKAVSLLEDGYRQNLEKYVSIFAVEEDGSCEPMAFPHSNCIVVAEKMWVIGDVS